MAYVGTPSAYGNTRDLLASVIQGEAGGQGTLGMTAVGAVIANRASLNFSGYGSDISSQLLARNQFQGQATPTAQSYSVADNILSGNYTDPTGGATSYANPGASSAAWARNLNSSNSVQIGAHYFTNNQSGIPFSGNGTNGIGTDGVAPNGNDPMGSSVTMNPSPSIGNDQGTPNLGGGASQSGLPTDTGNAKPTDVPTAIATGFNHLTGGFGDVITKATDTLSKTLTATTKSATDAGTTWLNSIFSTGTSLFERAGLGLLAIVLIGLAVILIAMNARGSQPLNITVAA